MIALVSREPVHRANPRRVLAVLTLVVIGLVLVAGEWLTGGHVWIFSWAIELAVAAVVLLAAWTAGHRLLALIWPGGRDTGSAVYSALGLGFGSIAAVVFALGGAGWLGRALLVSLLVAGAIAGTLDLVPAFRRWIRSTGSEKAPYRAIEAVAVVLPLALGFVYATLPPVFYDALVYHLGLPNLYVASGSLVYPESFSLAGYPQNAELILTLAMAAGDEVAVHLTGFFLTVLSALILRRLVLDRFGRVAGNLAYLLLVSQWFFSFQAVFLKVDLIGAFFLLAGFAAILDGRDTDGYRPWVVGGLLVGLAVGVKFANLIPVALAAVSLPWVVKTAVGTRWKRGLLLLVLALAVSSPWMIRNTIHRGNPFFPAFYERLGGTGWDDANAVRMRSETGMNLDRSVTASAKRLAGIGWRSGYGSGGEVSRAWMPLLLAGLLLSRRREISWLLGLAAVGLVLGLTFFSTYLRVYGWALLLIPLAGAVLWERFRHVAGRVALGLVFAAIALTGFKVSFDMCDVISAGGRRVILGRLSPADYLVERLSYTPIARYINESTDPAARIRVIGSARTAYIHRACIASYVWDDPLAAGLVDDEAATRRAIQQLRDDGFTHVLLDTGEMDRLERSQGLFGYSEREGGRNGIDRFLRGLTMVVEANGVYLFRVPEPAVAGVD